MDDSKKQELMKLLGITDERLADDVIAYAHKIRSSDSERLADGFALAKLLNEYVMTILGLVKEPTPYPYEDETVEIKDLNRAYVLIVNELKFLYNNNLVLFDIKAKPIWRTFDVLDGAISNIAEYFRLTSNDDGTAHMVQVKKYFVLAEKETPELTSEQQSLLSRADKAIAEYQDHKLKIETINQAQQSQWYTPTYALSYRIDGSIMVNDILKLKKAQAGSATDRLMEQATKQPNTLFKPELGQTSRNLSTILYSAGFTETLRKMFFPTVSRDKGIIFRPVVTQEIVSKERIDTTDLDNALRQKEGF